MGTRTLTLVRHGHYGPEDAGALTALGCEQAAKTGEYLQRFTFDVVISSTLKRARQTAAIIVGANARSNSRPDARPDEAGDEPRSAGALRVRPASVLREGMYSRIEGYEVPADEQAEDRARADAAWQKYFRTSRRDRSELIVCHGNLIRYLLCRALDVPVERWVRMTTNHCGITRVLIRDTGAVRVVSYNETSHLPLALVT